MTYPAQDSQPASIRLSSIYRDPSIAAHVVSCLYVNLHGIEGWLRLGGSGCGRSWSSPYVAGQDKSSDATCRPIVLRMTCRPGVSAVQQ